ncbi:MAG: T9SS type A sorting domain-containing protein, partial [Cytophagales bacterium]|nr:T9SS type A sorting domain-containing protein [Cytophagales bacterium]
YITFEAKVDRTDKRNSTYGIFMWDANGRYSTGATITNQTVPADGQWHRVTMDFTGQMVQGSEQIPLNPARIVRIHMHIEGGVVGSTNAWVVGDYYIRDLRIGSEVTELAGAKQVEASLNSVGKQWVSQAEDLRQVWLTGISSGNENTPAISIKTNTNGALGTVDISEVEDGTALLTIAPAGTTGKTTITLEVTATGVDVPATASFEIEVVNADATAQSVLKLDMDQSFQTIAGFGGFYDRSGGLAQDAVHNLGVSIIRVEIEPEFEEENDNDDPDVINFGALDYDYIFDGISRYREEFEKAGVDYKVIATAWTPPYWMKENLANEGGPTNSAPTWETTDNKVRPEFYEEYAEFLAAWWLAVKEKTGVEVYAICPQNEPAYSQFYNSAILSPERFAEVAAVCGPKFEHFGVTAKLFLPEQNFDQGVNGYSMLAYMQALVSHPTAAQYVDIIATHGYASDGIGVGNLGGQAWVSMKNAARDFTQVQGGPKALWMTETSGEADTWAQGAMQVAGAIGLGLTYGEVEGWVYWTLQGGADDEGAKYGYYRGATKSNKYYAAQHYYAFYKPGTVMKGITTSNNGLIVSAGEDPDGKIVIVVVNSGNNAIAASFDAEGDVPDNLTIIQSTDNSFVQERTPAGPKLLFPAKSITTLVADGIKVIIPISAGQVPNQNLVSDGSNYTVALSGIDQGGSTSGLSISAVSSNTALLPHPAASAIEAGSSTLTLEPVEGAEGTVTVTISVQSVDVVITRSFEVNLTKPGITGLAAKPSVQLFPVPGSSVVLVSAPGYSSVQLMDLTGKKLANQYLENSQAKIDIASLAPGVYLVKLSGTQADIIKKIIKE